MSAATLPARRAYRLTALAVVVAVGLAVAAGIAAWSIRSYAATAGGGGTGSNLTPSSAAGKELLGAARQAAVTYTSYDYRHLTQDFQDFAKLTTPALRKDYLRDAGALATQFRQLQVRAQSSVVTAGIGQVTAASGQPLTATVLIALDDVVSNRSAGSHSQTRYDRLVLSMQQIGGKWLCNGISAA